MMEEVMINYICFDSVLFQAMSLLYPKIVDLFHFAGDKQTMPSCPVELRPSLNPSAASPSYDESDPMCLKPAHYNLPFFLNRFGPKSSEWSINAHEARPGHHIQVTLCTYRLVGKAGTNLFASLISSFTFNQCIVPQRVRLSVDSFTWTFDEILKREAKKFSDR